MPATVVPGVAHTLPERLRIGREVKKALEAATPAVDQMTDEEVARELGVSQQYATRLILLACYKLRMKMREVVAQDDCNY